MLWARLRIWTGLVLALFVILHLSNHAAGLLSVELMEALRRLNALIWQNPVGTVALYGALSTHLFVALRTLYKRRTLRLAPWEMAQLLLGLAVPLMLIGHITGTRLNQVVAGFDVSYPYTLAVLWSGDWLRIKQSLLLAAVWFHLCVGLHYWWRNMQGYRRMLPWLYALAVVIPALSWVGFARSSLDVQAAFAADPAYRVEVFRGWREASPDARAILTTIYDWAPWGYLAIVGLVLAARGWRRRGENRGPTVRIEHPDRPVSARVGQTVLEALRAAQVPHASTCGGRARCTTCRIRVSTGAAELPAPESLEASALARIRAPEGVRLACQTRPVSNLSIAPLVAAGQRTERDTPGGVFGREREVAAMFVDLRGSTALNEARLPYDVVFILNQFFAEMSAALSATQGHYAQFAGDGLMALYGLESSLPRACEQALKGAVEMEERLARLNERLSAELPAPLRIGIGIHCGEAIVGTMGPPSSPNLSAIGDNINIAARLEGMTKEFGCVLVASEATLFNAGIGQPQWPRHEAPVRGREQPVPVYAIERAKWVQSLVLAGD